MRNQDLSYYFKDARDSLLDVYDQKLDSQKSIDRVQEQLGKILLGKDYTLEDVADYMDKYKLEEFEK